MSYKPILFNTEMVKAIQDGRKTQTRRIIKDFAGERITCVLKPDGSYGKYGTKGWRGMLPDRGDGNEYCIEVRPPCELGDILWVRERFCEPYEPGRYAYFADYDENKGITSPDGRLTLSTNIFRWKPSIHMPKGAARIFLRVKDVRIERMREISASDAMNEGFADWNEFVTLWNTTIKPADIDKYGWNANPWVWVIEFERCERPADFW